MTKCSEAMIYNRDANVFRCIMNRNRVAGKVTAGIIISKGRYSEMFKLKLRLMAVPLKLMSLEIYFLNAILSLLVMQKKLRTSKIVLLMDSRLAHKRDSMNIETERFIENYFLISDT